MFVPPLGLARPCLEYPIRFPKLIPGVRSRFVIVAARRPSPDRAEQQLGGEKLFADAPLGFELAAMPFAVRTCH